MGMNARIPLATLATGNYLPGGLPARAFELENEQLLYAVAYISVHSSTITVVQSKEA